METILDKIVARKKEEVFLGKKNIPEAELLKRLGNVPQPCSFYDALANAKGIGVIAETAAGKGRLPTRTKALHKAATAGLRAVETAFARAGLRAPTTALPLFARWSAWRTSSAEMGALRPSRVSGERPGPPKGGPCTGIGIGGGTPPSRAWKCCFQVSG